MDTCPFCRIINNLAPADVVAHGIQWLAFRPLNPHTPGHVLFVPRLHVTSATHNPRVTGHTFAAAARYLRAHGPQGNLLTSVGPAATQTVDHLHVHVIPRGPDDTLPTDWPWMRDTDA